MDTTLGNIIALRQERARLIGEARSVHDAAEGESRDLTAEESQEFDRIMSDVRSLTARVDRAEDLRNLGPGGVTREQPIVGSELSSEQRDVANTDEYREAFATYLRRGPEVLSAEQRNVLRGGYAGIPGSEQRDFLISNATAGGYTVPQDFYAHVVSAKVAAVAMRKTRALVIPTTNGRDLPIPVQSAYGAAAYLAEGVAATNVDDTGAKVTAKAYTVARMSKVSIQLLEDGGVDVEALIGANFGRAFAAFEDPEFVKGTGSGSSHITGVVSGTTVQQCATGSTTTFTYADLLAQYLKIQPQYRANGEWVIADSAMATLLGLKDSQNRPLWTANALPGEPDTLMGKPLYTSPNFATEAANSLYGVFGDFANGYAIRQDGGLNVRRTDERFIDSLEVGFIGWERLDGVILDNAAFVVMKHSAT
jgi:HK97 family phage major capsid protein